MENQLSLTGMLEFDTGEKKPEVEEQNNASIKVRSARENFDCCSRYRECSDKKRCLYEDTPCSYDPDKHLFCNYRTKLNQGTIYYGKNTTDLSNVPSFETKLYAILSKNYLELNKADQIKLKEICYQLAICCKTKIKDLWSGTLLRLADKRLISVRELYRAEKKEYMINNIPFNQIKAETGLKEKRKEEHIEWILDNGHDIEDVLLGNLCVVEISNYWKRYATELYYDYMLANDIRPDEGKSTQDIIEQNHILFNSWDMSLDKPENKARLERARGAECTPIYVSSEGIGYFVSDRGKYITSIRRCSCGDGGSIKRPCKHMYRLAIELGYLDYTVESDKGQIRRNIGMLTLRKAVEKIEALDQDSLHTLHEFLYHYFYGKNKGSPVGFIVNDALYSLINSNVLEIEENIPAALSVFTRYQIRDRLLQSGIDGFNKNQSFSDLVNWICDNVQNVHEVFPDAVAVNLQNDFIKSARKLYVYLNRRLINTEYSDSVYGTFTIPKGAQFFSYKIDSTVVLRCQFPEDEVTELLNKYGQNRCLKWNANESKL